MRPDEIRFLTTASHFGVIFFKLPQIARLETVRGQICCFDMLLSPASINREDRVVLELPGEGDSGVEWKPLNNGATFGSYWQSAIDCIGLLDLSSVGGGGTNKLTTYPLATGLIHNISATRASKRITEITIALPWLAGHWGGVRTRRDVIHISNM